MLWISTLPFKVERVKKPLGRLWEKEEEEEYEDSGISSLDTDSQTSQWQKRKTKNILTSVLILNISLFFMHFDAFLLSLTYITGFLSNHTVTWFITEQL